jgi:hypothetical protein
MKETAMVSNFLEKQHLLVRKNNKLEVLVSLYVMKLVYVMYIPLGSALYII